MLQPLAVCIDCVCLQLANWTDFSLTRSLCVEDEDCQTPIEYETYVKEEEKENRIHSERANRM